MNISTKKIFFSLLYFLIAGGITLDVLNGLMSMLGIQGLSPGAIVRAVIVGCGFLLISQNKYYKFLFYLSMIIFFLVAFWQIRGTSIDLAIELPQALKLLFPFALGSILWRILTHIDLDPTGAIKLLAIGSGILATVLVTSLSLGFGANTYAEGSFGNKGILQNQNDIAMTLSICVFFISLAAFNFSFKYFIVLGITMVALVLLGTRTSVSASVFFPSLAFIISYKHIRDAFGVRVLFIGSAFFLLSVVGGKFVIDMVLSDDYLLNKFISILEFRNPRGDLYDVGISILSEYSFFEFLLGRSATEFYNLVQNVGQFYSFHEWGKRVEVDPIDLIGCYGLLITCLLYAFYIRLIWHLSVGVYSTRQTKAELIFISGTILILCFYLVHSLVAGHAFLQPMQSTLIVFLATSSELMLKRNSTKRASINFIDCGSDLGNARHF